MTHQQHSINRRTFLKSAALAGGGFMLHFTWLNSFASQTNKVLDLPNAITELNGFLKIAEDGTTHHSAGRRNAQQLRRARRGQRSRAPLNW